MNDPILRTSSYSRMFLITNHSSSRRSTEEPLSVRRSRDFTFDPLSREKNIFAHHATVQSVNLKNFSAAVYEAGYNLGGKSVGSRDTFHSAGSRRPRFPATRGKRGWRTRPEIPRS